MSEAASRSWVRRLQFHRFRNLLDATLELTPGLTIVHGRNGQGKTSLLEAVYLVGSTKSFRTGQTRELVRSGESDSIVAAELQGQRVERLAVRLRGRAGNKELQRGSRTVAVQDYLGAIHPIAFTAESRELVAGPPERRRAFVDRGVAAELPGYLAELGAWKRALRQKARLLETRSRPQEIEAWNAELARRAGRISALRNRWIDEVKKKVPEVARRIFVSSEALEVCYRSSPPGLCAAQQGGGGAEGVSRSLLEAMREALPREMAARRPLIGPQRDEVELKLGGHDAAAYASAGEQRRVAFLLTMAAAELAGARSAAATVVLMDDVEAEFDDERLDRVIRYLGSSVQTLLATSKRDVAGKYAALGQAWLVEEGRFRPWSDEGASA